MEGLYLKYGSFYSCGSLYSYRALAHAIYFQINIALFLWCLTCAVQSCFYSLSKLLVPYGCMSINKLSCCWFINSDNLVAKWSYLQHCTNKSYLNLFTFFPRITKINIVLISNPVVLAVGGRRLIIKQGHIWSVALLGSSQVLHRC